MSGEMVGRVAMRRQLEAALDAAARGHGSIVAITGPAGIGKTRLAEAVIEVARKRGIPRLVGRCLDLSGTSLPYFPLVEALRPLTQRNGLIDLPTPLRHVSRLFPALLADPDRVADTPTGSAQHSQHLLFGEVLAVLDHVAVDPNHGGRGLVTVIEDVHWADSSTLDLLAFLAAPIRNRHHLLLLTYRDDSVSSDDQAARLIAGLARTRIGRIHRLGPLGGADLKEMLDDIAGAPVAPHTTASILARADGNPFFARELLLAGGDGTGLPQGLRDVLVQRLSRLGPVALLVLRVAAAVGHEIPAGLLSRVIDLPDEELWAALREAVEHDVLTVDHSAGTYRFGHSLLAEAAYDMVLPGERETIHGRLADALTKDPGLAAGTTVAAEVARHCTVAGRLDDAFRASIDAAHDAQAVAGHGDAFVYVQDALALWHRVREPHVVAGFDRAALLAWAAELASLFGHAQAPDLVTEALSDLGPDADPIRIGLLEERLGSYALDAGRREEGLEALRRAVERIPQAPASSERAHVMASLGIALVLSCRFSDALAACDEAIAAADKTGNSPARIKALSAKGISLGYLGRLGEGIACLEVARESAVRHGTPSDVTRTYRMQADVLRLAGRLEEATRITERGMAEAARLGVLHSDGILISTQDAQSKLGLGQWREADAALVPTLRSDSAYWAELPYLVRAELAILRGEESVAEDMLAASARVAEEPRWAPTHARLRAEFAVLKGQLVDAVDAIDVGLTATREETVFEQVRLAAVGLQAVAGQVIASSALGDADAAARAIDDATRLLETATKAAEATTAISDDVAAWLAQAVAEHGRISEQPSTQDWSAALSEWTARGRPYQQSYSGYRLAEATVAAEGSTATAGLVAREALQIARDLGAAPLVEQIELLARRARLRLAEPKSSDPGAVTIDLTDHAGLASPLTPREREVLTLVAQGCTNREIAADLTISIKTASVHVSHILSKFGVSSRVEAAAVAQQLKLI